tara:strand:- start:870 stop:3695 length:2826 start_codon:yes stop_codon:yes gene_type:complete
MEKNFLIKISKILFSKYRENISDLAIVLPSRRASVFMTQSFSHFISKPIWLPQFYSIDDFLLNINNLNRVNSLELFFDFFSIYKEHVKNPHDIERCYKWAGGLLEDFNKIDKSYTEYMKLFNYLSDLKRIENWYLEIGSHKDEIGEYLNFFQKLEHIYKDLKDLLLSKRAVYPGLSERLLVDNLYSIHDWLKQNKKSKIIFIGLDTLTISQEKIINYLLKNNLCEIFWDSDSYFIDNPKQESGKFLRKYRKKWPKQFYNIENDFLTIKKQIDIIGTTKNINQAKLLGSILNDKNYNSDQLKKVAIILPNENLLLSVLESMPSHINDINITMGYKLSHHSLLSLFQDLLTLYSHQQVAIQKSSSEEPYYLMNDLTQLFQNTYFKLILDSIEVNLQRTVLKQIKSKGLNYIKVSDINNKKIINHALLNKMFYNDPMTGLKLINIFLELVFTLLELITNQNDSSMIEQECLFKIEEQLLLCKQFIAKSNQKINIKLFAKLFNKVIKSIRLKFSGEPLQGIQIMGLLESRTIDFDEIFILSANESELPPSHVANSFIPIDVKQKFNIRTELDMDLIYANHFFNLIKRPKKTHIIYNQDMSSSSSGERSRFINQLVYEIKPLMNTEIKIREYIAMDKFILENNAQSRYNITDDYILQKLLTLSENGFSPSTMNLYNYCKKQFYFEKIIGVSEIKPPTYNLDTSDIGLIVHTVLQKLYEPYLHIDLDNNIMKNIQESIDIEIKNALHEYQNFNLNRGKNVLILDAVQRIISSFVLHESNLIREGNSIVIEFLEYKSPISKFKTTALDHLPTEIKKTINLKGYIDRVDIFNQQYRIIDYKTGLIKSSELVSSDLTDITSKPKILQLLLYAWLFTREPNIKKLPILTGVINLRARDFKFQQCILENQSQIDSKILMQFENALDKIFIDMFNPKQNFEHIDRDQNCRFCD